MEWSDKVSATLEEIVGILKRIEDRQIKTTGMVQHIESAKPAVVGSFASTEQEQKQ